MIETVKPLRSMLFVPGHKPDWVEKAIAAGPDALILDLEDSVPDSQKDEARAAVRNCVMAKWPTDSMPARWVRPNALETGLAGFDVDAVVEEGLAGLVLPKVSDPADLIRFDALITHFERKRGLEPSSVAVVVAVETAQSMVRCEELAHGPRVLSLLGATGRNADVARALGYRYTIEGLETLYLRSRILLACRAAGLEQPIGGLWEDVGDVAGLRLFSEQQRQLGYRGQIVIHPSHVATVNEVFTPSTDEIAFYQRVLDEYERAIATGSGALLVDGQHIDIAHVKSARSVIAVARFLGLGV